MKSFLQVGDVHLGYRQFQLAQRELDYYAACQYVADMAIERGVDVLVLTGDLFETPRPRTAAIACALKFKSRLKRAGIDLVGISGNHDAADPDWLDILGAHNLNRGPYEMEPGCLMYGHSYMSQEETVTWLETVAPMDDCTFAVLHQTFDKIAPHPSALDFTMEDLPPHKIILCGHVHQLFLYTDPVKDTTVHYTGNTEFWRLGEDLSKSYSVWEDGTHTVHTIPTRPVIDYTLTGNDDTRALKEGIRILDDRVGGGAMPIILLRYGTQLGKVAREVQAAIKGKVLALKMIPQREVQPVRKKVHQPGLSHAAIVNEFIPQGTEASKLAHVLVSAPDTVESALSGYRESYLAEEGHGT